MLACLSNAVAVVATGVSVRCGAAVAGGCVSSDMGADGLNLHPLQEQQVLPLVSFLNTK